MTEGPRRERRRGTKTVTFLAFRCFVDPCGAREHNFRQVPLLSRHP